jgi:o-succinylbenzoate synthase
MRTTAVDVTGRRVPFAEDFPVSYDDHRTTDHVYVRVRTDVGPVGYGEGTSLPWFTGELTDGMVEVTRKWLVPRIEGQTLEAADAAVESFVESYPGGAAAKAAAEMALLDLRAKRAELALHEFLGPKVTDDVAAVTVIPALTPDRAAARAADAAAKGFHRFKLKATGDVAADATRAEAVLEVIPSDATLRIDANTGWKTAATAIRAVEAIDESDRIEYVEQPVRRSLTEDLRHVWEATGVPVYADEAVTGPDDVERLGRDGLVAGVHLKLAKAGSLRRLVETARVARRHGLSVSAVSAFGTSVEAAANLHLAATLPHRSGGIELCTNLLADDPTTDPIEVTPTVSVPDGPGVGVEPDDSVF